ncbi:hypothetical protein [Luteimonas sp. 3794]|uniref:hypothetical protein n=1 Tax=Luteimonas sp. 3794 TaxID=2817730 RepID=UPI0028558ACC|nr:hypothetical protein [Luteimonas sp. 3794]MDR6990271.1 hypothetical protein [Luteimonas sp. 3794]
MHVVIRALGVLMAAAWLAGCATGFPRATAPYAAEDGLDGAAVLARGVDAHGGDLRTRAADLNYASDGRWESLIQRIQPVVTDAGYRVTAETRYAPAQGLHAIRYQGPKGIKQVVRRPGDIEVYYDGVRTTDPEILQAAAMTTDAFELFHFGPSFLAARATQATRMADVDDAGTRYQRVRVEIAPGFGEAANDTVIAWFDAQTHLLHRVHLTLNGFPSTQGAHVDTTMTGYRALDGVMLPTRFHERVRGPLRIDAHTWWVTGLDAGRGWTAGDVAEGGFNGSAARPADVLRERD